MITEATLLLCSIVIFAGLYMVTHELHQIGALIYRATFIEEGDNEG